MNVLSIFILGRQPAIGRAELESRFGSSHIQPIGDFAVACDIKPDEIPFAQLGSSIRLAKPFAITHEKNWRKIISVMSAELPGHIRNVPEGKLKFGISVFGLPIKVPLIHQAGLELKKAAKLAGRSARVVPNTERVLSSAQVFHNHLVGDVGMEFLVIKSGQHTLIAQTVAVQDINAYAARDQNRPKRDARVGMLPPKLAQTITNLAIGEASPQAGHPILDPFCGTGVLLQEAQLMGFDVYGTDLEPRMVEYSQKNLGWLHKNFKTLSTTNLLEVGDATSHQWQNANLIQAVASETYLGRPLSNWPKPETRREIIKTCNVIIEKFLRNLAGQLKANTRLCLAVPCWKSPEGAFFHLPVLDRLEEIGYNRMSFKHANTHDLVYYRPDQVVARELLVITRK